jgi:hypothetical protein
MPRSLLTPPSQHVGVIHLSIYCLRFANHRTQVPTPSNTAAVKAILATMTTSNMQTNLNALTAFNNRYYTSTTGVQASTWILNKVKEVGACSD